MEGGWREGGEGEKRERGTSIGEWLETLNEG